MEGKNQQWWHSHSREILYCSLVSFTAHLYQQLCKKRVDLKNYFEQSQGSIHIFLMFVTSHSPDTNFSVSSDNSNNSINFNSSADYNINFMTTLFRYNGHILCFMYMNIFVWEPLEPRAPFNTVNVPKSNHRNGSEITKQNKGKPIHQKMLTKIKKKFKNLDNVCWRRTID